MFDSKQMPHTQRLFVISVIAAAAVGFSTGNSLAADRVVLAEYFTSIY